MSEQDEAVAAEDEVPAVYARAGLASATAAVPEPAADDADGDDEGEG